MCDYLPGPSRPVASGGRCFRCGGSGDGGSRSIRLCRGGLLHGASVRFVASALMSSLPTAFSSLQPSDRRSSHRAGNPVVAACSSTLRLLPGYRVALGTMSRLATAPRYPSWNPTHCVRHPMASISLYTRTSPGGTSLVHSPHVWSSWPHVLDNQHDAGSTPPETRSACSKLLTLLISTRTWSRPRHSQRQGGPLRSYSFLALKRPTEFLVGAL